MPKPKKPTQVENYNLLLLSMCAYNTPMFDIRDILRRERNQRKKKDELFAKRYCNALLRKIPASELRGILFFFKSLQNRYIKKHRLLAKKNIPGNTLKQLKKQDACADAVIKRLEYLFKRHCKRMMEKEAEENAVEFAARANDPKRFYRKCGYQECRNQTGGERTCRQVATGSDSSSNWYCEACFQHQPETPHAGWNKCNVDLNTLHTAKDAPKGAPEDKVDRRD